MGLAKDPEARERQLANLAKGREKAAQALAGQAPAKRRR